MKHDRLLTLREEIDEIFVNFTLDEGRALKNLGCVRDMYGIKTANDFRLGVSIHEAWITMDAMIQAECQ